MHRKDDAAAGIKSRVHSCFAELSPLWHPGYLLAAVLIAGLCREITGCGVLYTDSTTRIGFSAAILGGRWEDLRPYLTLLPEFFMALCYKLTQTHSTYIWLQASFFLWTVFEFAGQFLRGVWRYAVLLLAPLLAGYGIFWEMNVVSAACLLWLLMLEKRTSRMQTANPLVWALYGLLVFVMTGFRLNAATAAVGLVLLGIPGAARSQALRRALVCKTVAVVLAVAAAFSFPRLVGVRGSSNGAFGFLWELCCMVDALDDADPDTDLDYILGDGMTEKFRHTDQPIRYYTDFGYGVLYEATLHHSQDIYREYIRFAHRHPLIFARVKATFILRSLTPLYEAAFGEETWGFAEATPRRHMFCAAVQYYQDKMLLLRTPWLLFLAAGVLAALARARRGAVWPAVFAFLALCHYSALFVTTQSFEFRYFFPTCLLLVFSCFLALQILLCRRPDPGRAP